MTVGEPKLDFRDVTDTGQIFLGKLAAGLIGEENAALLGSLLVSKLHQVSLARAGQAEETRRPFFLYIDEFHHVATPSMGSLFSGMRKYRLGVTVAHQDLYQLHASVPEVERSLLANAYTRICFRVGEEDARQLTKGLSYFEPDDLMRLGLGEAVCRVGGRDDDFNLRTDPLDKVDAEEATQRREHLRHLSAERWGVPVEKVERVQHSREASTTADRDAPPATKTTPPARQKRVAPSPAIETQPEPTLDKPALDYLELVARGPFLTVRERNTELNLSAWKGDRLKTKLLGRNLVREVPINPGGRGTRFKLLELTQTGRDILADVGIAPSVGHGRGGIAHQWWAYTISSWLEQQGYPSTIEDESSGARVDVVFTVRRKKIAVEIEIAEGHTLENITKDQAAGFSSIVSLQHSPNAVDRVSTKLTSEAGELPPGVLVGHLPDYVDVLSPLLVSSSSSLRPPNQDKEPRRRRQPTSSASQPIQLFEPGAFSTPLAADYLGLSPATLETLRSRGGGPTFSKLGRRVVYRREDLAAWLNERQRRSTSDDGLQST